MARYLFVWLVYFSVAYTAKKEAHIRIDAAINIYPKKARPYVEILSEIIVLAFAVFKMCISDRQTGVVSPGWV